MLAWLSLILLTPSLQAEVDASRVDRRGLSVMVGRVGAGPMLVIAPDSPRTPASNMKILTGAAAMARLGPEFRFVTQFVRTKEGDLVVVGDGDPNWSGRFFDDDPDAMARSVARDLKKHGVTRVRDLVLDASRFDDVTVHPDWPRDQLHRWYCAPVAALVFNDSCWDFRVKPGGRAGRPARIEIEPSLLEPALINRCETITRGNHVVHVARLDDGSLSVRGRVQLTSRGVPANLTVGKPVAFFGRALRAALRAEGITVAGAVRRGKRPVDGERVMFVRSRIERTMRVMMTNSQNLYAECLFKRLGSGSFESAAERGAASLARAGISIDGLDWRDGSGLARTNRVTARTVYEALQRYRDEPVFVDSFAAGGTGTLRRRYKSLGDRVRAKTGTIRGVSALSGYVTGRKGGRYVFVVLCNGRSRLRARALQDRIVTWLARQS